MYMYIYIYIYLRKWQLSMCYENVHKKEHNLFKSRNISLLFRSFVNVRNPIEIYGNHTYIYTFIYIYVYSIYIYIYIYLYI